MEHTAEYNYIINYPGFHYMCHTFRDYSVNRLECPEAFPPDLFQEWQKEHNALRRKIMRGMRTLYTGVGQPGQIFDYAFFKYSQSLGSVDDFRRVKKEV